MLLVVGGGVCVINQADIILFLARAGARLDAARRHAGAKRGSLTAASGRTRRTGSATTGVGGGFLLFAHLLVRLASKRYAKNHLFCAAYPDNTVAAQLTAPKAYDAQGCPSFRGCP